jgi:short-subunit dehydrogenase
MTALVTGPTAGIGLAFAEQLAQRGEDLVLVARDRVRLEELAERLAAEYGVSCEVLPADLTVRSELAAVESRLASLEDPISLLVNNAGFGLKQRFGANSVEQEQAMLDVLVVAVMRLSHAALGAMHARASAGESSPGGIINVSSVASYLPRGTYSAAKAWVNSFSEWAANEYRPDNVTVMALLPGFTKTEFHQRMDVSRGSAPSWMWLDADALVAEALDDFYKGKTYSVPSVRYKALSTVARAMPSRLLQKFQLVGRK